MQLNLGLGHFKRTQQKYFFGGFALEVPEIISQMDMVIGSWVFNGNWHGHWETRWTKDSHFEICFFTCLFFTVILHQELVKIPGVSNYELRLLWHLFFLRSRTMHVVPWGWRLLIFGFRFTQLISSSSKVLGLPSLKLTFLHPKMVVSNRNLLFQGLFSGAMLVSGRVDSSKVLMDIFVGWYGYYMATRFVGFVDLVELQWTSDPPFSNGGNRKHHTTVLAQRSCVHPNTSRSLGFWKIATWATNWFTFCLVPLELDHDLSHCFQQNVVPDFKGGLLTGLFTFNSACMYFLTQIRHWLRSIIEQIWPKRFVFGMFFARKSWGSLDQVLFELSTWWCFSRRRP